MLGQGRTVVTHRARDAAREIFGAPGDAELERLERLLGLKHVVLAPLRYNFGISGVLAVAGVQLRRSDPEAIDAFALQASIALEQGDRIGFLRDESTGAVFAIAGDREPLPVNEAQTHYWVTSGGN